MRLPFGRKAKKLVMRFASQPAFLQFFNSGRDINFLSEVGSGFDSSVIMIPIQWIMRSFPEPPLVVDQRGEEDWEVDVNHPLAMLMERPNPHFSGELVWQAIIASLMLTGDGYLIKIQDSQLRVSELWYSPPELMEPKWPLDGSEFISHYEYKPGFESIILAPEQVVHFRIGTDPTNIRKGLSPLASVLREVFSDDEAGRFSAALLKNMGVIGLIISPDGDAVVGDDDLEASKAALEEHYTGSRRGKPFVAGAPTKVHQFGFSPEQMDLKMMRRVPEERVSAALGVPAIVAGFGAGLDRSTFANMSEAREMATESTLVPLWRLLAADLSFQLLPDFEPDPRNWRMRFELDEVRVLQEDQNKLIERKLKELNGGAIMLSTYLKETGREAEDKHNVYLRPMNLVEVREDDLGKEPEPPPDPVVIDGPAGEMDPMTGKPPVLHGAAAATAAAAAGGNGGN
jgi:HK97 family phage portal protein